MSRTPSPRSALRAAASAIAVLSIASACQGDVPAQVGTPPTTTAGAATETVAELLEGRIVFQSNRDGDWDIYAMNADGSGLVQLTDHPAEDGYPVWSPDGERIAFESKRDGRYRVFVMAADGSGETPLTSGEANDFNPAWSPDGERIVFTSDRDGSNELFEMRADGGDVRKLTSGLGQNGIADWSPDGERIAYTGNRYLGWNVYVMDADGSNDRRLTDGHGACRPDWAPDGQRLAYVSQEWDGKGDIGLITGPDATRTRLTTDDEHYDYFPDFSPDGRFIVYAKTTDKKRGNWNLWVIPVDGGTPVQLTDHPANETFPKWTSGRLPAS